MRIPKNNNNNNQKQFQLSPRKKGFITCSLCGRNTDWHCWITEDGGLAYCKFTPNTSGKKDSKGRYEHILRKGSERNLITVTNPMKEHKLETLKADAERLDAVYTAFLKEVGLSDEHQQSLVIDRGLLEIAVANNLYATVPSKVDGDKVAQKLAQSFNLVGVPGFYYENDLWCLVVNYRGFYVPYRDEQGRIVGLQIRKDFNEKPKYLWLSSGGKEKGVTSGAPIHFTNSGFLDGDSILITEGALKADIISADEFKSVVAIAGVSAINHQNFVDYILKVYNNLKSIIIAFDMDWKEKEDVRRVLKSLLKELENKPVEVYVADWDIAYGKGLDDVLHNSELNYALEGIVKYLSVQEFTDLLNEIEFEQLESFEFSINESKVSSEVEQGVLAFEQNEQNEPTEPDFTLEQEFISEDSIDTFGISWGDFSRIDFQEPERVIFGLSRGNVGQLVASTNLGKTTLMLNLAISACSERPFEPLLNNETIGKRILYIDGEATKAELQADINKMLKSCSLAQRELLKSRLYLICDEELDDEPLDLVNPEHIAKITNIASRFNPDLIVVDTLSALANMEDENDNAKVKKEIIQPLKTLAKKTDSAVLVLHHTGKFNEGSPQAQDAYKGRGASAFGALARVVFNLKEQKGKAVLSCSKVKGNNFQSVIMELDQNTRWFKKVGVKDAQDIIKPESNYEQVVRIVRDQFGKPIKRNEIEKILASKSKTIETPTLTRILKEAVEKGDLIKPNYGHYAVPVNAETELSLN